MKKPEESDLVRLVKDLERKRQEREKLREQQFKLEQDLDKILEYYNEQQRKLRLQSDATFREIRVKDVEIQNAEEVLRQSSGIYNELTQTGCRAGKSCY